MLSFPLWLFFPISNSFLYTSLINLAYTPYFSFFYFPAFFSICSLIFIHFFIFFILFLSFQLFICPSNFNELFFCLLLLVVKLSHCIWPLIKPNLHNITCMFLLWYMYCIMLTYTTYYLFLSSSCVDIFMYTIFIVNVYFLMTQINGISLTFYCSIFMRSLSVFIRRQICAKTVLT